MINNRMTQNFGRVLISSVYAKIDNPKKDIKMVRVPVRTEEEYMEQHKKYNKNHGGLCEIVGLDEFQVKPYFDLDPKGDFDYSIIDSFCEDIKSIYDADIFISGREPREEKGLKGKTIIKHSRRIYLKARISYYNIPIVFKKLFDKYNGLIDTSVYSPTRVLFVPLSDRKKNLDVPVLQNLKGSIFDCCASYIQEDYEDLDKFIESNCNVPPEPVRKSKVQELLDKVNNSLCDDAENSNESNLNFTEIMTKLSKERATNYNDWMFIGIALINLNHRKIITRGQLYDLFDLFSSKTDNYDADGVNKFLEINIPRFDGKGYGIKYLL